MKRILFSFAATFSALSAAPDGAQLFTTNCSACHMLDQMVVGPSLVEIRGLYDGKPDDFVKWSNAPFKKRDGVIEMPSMIHVGEEGLSAIYTHVMQISKGVVAKKQEKGDPFISSPTHVSRPQVQRIFMPDAGPAAIAVALDYGTSLCWDAGSCRLRYAWTGGFIDGFPYWQGNGSSVAKINGVVKYKEADSPFGSEGERKFLGYGVRKGLPVFRYMIGSRTVTEGYSPVTDGTGFVRSFTLSPTPTAPLVLRFPAESGVAISSDKGSLEGSKLILQPADAAAFTLTFSLK
jgi:cytochrome c551/c552